MNSLLSYTQSHHASRTSGRRFQSVGTAFTWLLRQSANLDWRVIANSVRLLAMTILVLLASYALSANGQKEPDAKRKAEIIAALSTHGFPAANWEKARSIMHQIAAGHPAQAKHDHDLTLLCHCPDCQEYFLGRTPLKDLWPEGAEL